MDYLKDFFQKLMRAYPADFISLYANFSLPEELKNIIREQTTQAFEKLWKNPDFRLYMFYRHKTGKNISGTLDFDALLKGELTSKTSLNGDIKFMFGSLLLSKQQLHGLQL